MNSKYNKRKSGDISRVEMQQFRPYAIQQQTAKAVDKYSGKNSPRVKYYRGSIGHEDAAKEQAMTLPALVTKESKSGRGTNAMQPHSAIKEAKNVYSNMTQPSSRLQVGSTSKLEKKIKGRKISFKPEDDKLY